MEEHAALQQQLLAHERSYWAAIKDKNAKVAARLTDDPCIVVGAQDVGELSRGALSKILEGATYDLNEFSLEGVRVRRLSNDIAEHESPRHDLSQWLLPAGADTGRWVARRRPANSL